MRTVALVLLAITASTPCAYAQTAPDSENGRYAFAPVPDGMLRLDTRSGAVSICTKKDTGWSCNSVPDERTALENEIARLQRENGTLKKEMLARGVPLPGGIGGASTAEQQRELNLKVPLPSDAEIDRVMTAFVKIWRSLIDMMQKTPGGDRI